jgi:hypothetical protein
MSSLNSAKKYEAYKNDNTDERFEIASPMSSGLVNINGSKKSMHMGDDLEQMKGIPIDNLFSSINRDMEKRHAMEQ